jgi:hypothetical protein
MKEMSYEEAVVKQEQVETEMTSLFKYMDERKMPPDIGLSMLLSALMTITSDLGIPLSPIIEAMHKAKTLRTGDETLH